ncbi:hypothetical protein BRSU_2800 [Brachyspira suanatina]|uniref:Uncharacterized protein n=1 Tax=Brachyspira suanatina TaxID=381802 RepID=A0A0G4KB57_9SPIR|nr:hypothetical protein [Brachyspira suanatina]CRF35678.1 hypothetical protein BRSU_2800 [Brachyspira suanatina]
MNMWEEINPCYSQNLLLYVHKDLAYIFKNNLKITNRPIFFYHPAYVNTIVHHSNNDINNLTIQNSQLLKLNENTHYIKNKYEELKLNLNWFSILSIFGIQLFTISNNSNYLRLTVLGIKLTFKVNEESINKIAWWIPIKSLRNSFRVKFKIEDQTKPNFYTIHFCIYNNTKTKKL